MSNLSNNRIFFRILNKWLINLIIDAGTLLNLNSTIGPITQCLSKFDTSVH